MHRFNDSSGKGQAKAETQESAERGTMVFLLGVAADKVAGNFSKEDIVYSDSLEVESVLNAAGFATCYVYRNCNESFERAIELSLAWLTGFPSRARACHIGFATLFSDSRIPLWSLCYDALFEIKGGIFENIFHLVLLKDILARSPQSTVQVCASRGSQLAQAIVLLLGDRADINWIDDQNSSERRNRGFLLRCIWKRINTFLICPFLVGMRRLWEIKKGLGKVALIESFGDMARFYRDHTGRHRIGDVYYENLEPVLDAACTDIIKVGINAPKMSKHPWKNQWLEWRLILLGTYRPWYAYASIGDKFQVVSDRKKFRAALEIWDVEQEFQRLFEIEGISFYPLLRPLLFEMLPGMLASAGLHYAIASRFVKREKVALVISVESFSSLGRCLALSLHQSGGKLWGIQGGVISPKRVTNIGFYVPALAERQELIPDRFFVWGPEYKALLSKFHVPDDRVCVMGFNRGKKLSIRSPSSGNKQILYVTGANALVCPYLMTIEEENYTLLELADCLPEGAELVVRTHPRHNVNDYRKLLGAKKNVHVLSSSEIALEKCLTDAVCVVGKASTVLLEAAYVGKRVLLINLAGTPDFTGFAGSLPCAVDRLSLRAHLERLTGDETTGDKYQLARFVERWCTGSVSSTTQWLLAELIKEGVATN